MAWATGFLTKDVSHAWLVEAIRAPSAWPCVG